MNSYGSKGEHTVGPCCAGNGIMCFIRTGNTDNGITILIQRDDTYVCLCVCGTIYNTFQQRATVRKKGNSWPETEIRKYWENRRD
jgi:hypothetical protein